jgi:hypothetical protein
MIKYMTKRPVSTVFDRAGITEAITEQTRMNRNVEPSKYRACAAELFVPQQILAIKLPFAGNAVAIHFCFGAMSQEIFGFVI